MKSLPLIKLIPLFLSVLLLSGCVHGTGTVSESVSPSAAALEPTEYAVAVPTRVPSPTAAPTPTPEPEPTPAPTPTPLPDGHIRLTEDELLMLVNFEYRLPDGYVPPDLVSATELMGDSCTVEHPDSMIRYEVGLYLKAMFEAAYEEGIKTRFRINSSCRTMEEQWALWNKRRAMDPHYGEDPYNDPVGVMPGNASEHVAGLSFDIASEAFPYESFLFSNTEEGQWLAANAHRFGFILRYPADKTHITGIKFEPWHFRFVGPENALAIFESGLCLEEYLGKTP